MARYGVKLTNAKLVWVQADEAECRDGAVLFFRTEESRKVLIAGFSLQHVNHFGIPAAFAADADEKPAPAV